MASGVKGDLKEPQVLRLYDTLQGTVRVFEPMVSNRVKLYVCGPTVYDDAHLGHARCYMTWDVLYRYLTGLGYSVSYVRNITDVDDKIIQKAIKENTTAVEIATRFNERFQQDMENLNILLPTAQPKATEHMAIIHQAIGDLIDKGKAYQAKNGTVYFRTSACEGYGKLSKKPLDDLRSGARVEVDPDKESPLDFALWKPTADSDPFFWDSPWGKGRPGWHIECSAMNYAQFGEQIDIHAGGADLIFPHHENEIAQSECWTDKKPFSKYWMHNGFVNVSGEKMSKSLGNFATVRTILERYDANVIRYFLLQHHYRMPVDFNDEALSSSENRMRKIYRTFVRVLETLNIPVEDFASSKYQAGSLPSDYLEAMAEDVNTPKALAVFNALLGNLEKSTDVAQDFATLVAIWDSLGFSRLMKLQDETLPESVYQIASDLTLSWELGGTSKEALLSLLLEKRKEAKQNKDWALSDKIRDQLKAVGVILMDNKDGTTTYEVVKA